MARQSEWGLSRACLPMRHRCPGENARPAVWRARRIGLVYTAVSLAAASLTDRRAFASIAVILLMLGASIAVNVMVEAAEMSAYLLLLDPLSTPLEIPARLFGDRTPEYLDLGTPMVVLANRAWFAGGASIVGVRYRKLQAV